MAVKIRLSRRGRKKLALFDVVVADSRSPRDGRFIEKIGTYNPNTNPASINIDDARALTWLQNGAQPTDTVRAMLSYRGVLYKKHLQLGVAKGAITQEQADAKFEAWLKAKAAKIESKVAGLSQSKADQFKARLEAETKIREARAEALRQKAAAAALALEPAAEEAAATEEVVVEASEGEASAEVSGETEASAEASAE